MKCPKCFEEQADGRKFCAKCGADLREMPANESLGEVTPGTETLDGGESQNKEISQNTSAVVEDMDEERFSQPNDSFVSEAPTATYSHIPQEPEKGKKSPVKYIVGGVIGVALIAIIAVFCFSIKGSVGGGISGIPAIAKKDPKEAVIYALKSVYSDETERPAESVFGFGGKTDTSVAESIEGEFSLQLKSSSDPTIATLAGSGLTFMGRTDVNTNKSEFGMDVLFGGMDFAKLKLYVDDTNMALTLPGIYDKVLTVNYKDDLVGQLERSPYIGPLLQQSGMDLEGLSSYFDYINETVDTKDGQVLDFAGLWTRYKDGSKALTSLKEAMEVTNISDESLTVNGKSEKCKGYDVTIKKEDFVTFISESADFFMNDETFKKEFIDYMTQVINMSERLYGQNPYGMSGEEMFDTLMAVENRDNLIAFFDTYMTDVKMKVYVNKKGQLAQLDLTTKVDDEGDITDISLLVNCEGGDYLTQNMTAKFNMINNGKIYGLNFDRSGSYADKKLEGKFDLAFLIDEEDFVISGAGDYDETAKKYNLSLDLGGSVMDNAQMPIKITVDGTINELVKGKTFDATMDNIDFIVNDVSMVTLSGTLVSKPLEGAIEMPGGEAIDVIGMTQEEFMEAGNSILAGLYSSMGN